jgi:hypothetical protein
MTGGRGSGSWLQSLFFSNSKSADMIVSTPYIAAVKNVPTYTCQNIAIYSATCTVFFIYDDSMVCRSQRIDIAPLRNRYCMCRVAVNSNPQAGTVATRKNEGTEHIVTDAIRE